MIMQHEVVLQKAACVCLIKHTLEVKDLVRGGISAGSNASLIEAPCRGYSKKRR